MANPITSKRILLGVTGSIACYKAADLASKMRQSGAEVDVILTESAQQFIAPLTFQAVTGRRAHTDQDLWKEEGHILHIGLAEAADLLVIAPATANTIAKLAQGGADNLITITALAARCPILLAPAMDGGMYQNPATQKNVETLHDRGVILVGPQEGHLASGLSGIGRMVEPMELLGHIRLTLAHEGPLEGCNIVVTAGGTQESIDPVRVITNRSSGKQGFAIAQAALDMGAQVTLIAAPTHLATPLGARRVNVQSAQDMCEAVLEAVANADALVMAAAVADFRPEKPARQKIKKREGVPEIRLSPAPDILAEVARMDQRDSKLKVKVGFAAESQALVENAQSKLSEKDLDLIAANDISASDAGFAVDTNQVTILYANGQVEALPLMSKSEVAQRVMEEVVKLLNRG